MTSLDDTRKYVRFSENIQERRYRLGGSILGQRAKNAKKQKVCCFIHFLISICVLQQRERRTSTDSLSSDAETKSLSVDSIGPMMINKRSASDDDHSDTKVCSLLFHLRF
jgi:hypothetical protein